MFAFAAAIRADIPLSALIPMKTVPNAVTRKEAQARASSSATNYQPHRGNIFSYNPLTDFCVRLDMRYNRVDA